MRTRGRTTECDGGRVQCKWAVEVVVRGTHLGPVPVCGSPDGGGIREHGILEGGGEDDRSGAAASVVTRIT